jgi:predicted MPP superfamily phosphohydrolase
MGNVRWLRGESVRVEHEGRKIEIVGLDCTHKPFLDAPVMLKSMNGSGPDTFRILLYHTPDLAPEAAQAGIDLQLSGHTHGGQLRLPFYGALYAASLYGKAFESGRRQVGNLTLYVSRGIGMEGGGAPRMRFNCAPEIILWELS